jgi:hypothetical protein
MHRESPNPEIPEFTYKFYKMFKFDKLVKSPKFSHACEGRHPELNENTGFPLSRE